jgi:DNA-binding NarL/FixJ family response regulator
MRKHSPASKILFVTQESSADFVEEAFGIGAVGYLTKMCAGKELLPAVDAVLDGRQFLCTALSGLVETASRV